VFGGTQVSSCEDTDIVVIKADPGASSHHSFSLFLLSLFYL
jgi:hypothetical protein